MVGECRRLCAFRERFGPKCVTDVPMPPCLGLMSLLNSLYFKRIWHHVWLWGSQYANFALCGPHTVTHLGPKRTHLG